MKGRAAVSTRFVAIDRACWRVLTPRWASEPLSGGGAAKRGGRWNEPGQPALYFSEDHTTAFAEYMQDLERPGLFTPYHVEAERIVDLCDSAVRAAIGVDETAMLCAWKAIARIEKQRPPTWAIAAALLAGGADGVRVPSAQRASGVNIVLWRWNEPASPRVTVRDPSGDLPLDQRSWEPHESR